MTLIVETLEFTGGKFSKWVYLCRICCSILKLTVYKFCATHNIVLKRLDNLTPHISCMKVKIFPQTFWEWKKKKSSQWLIDWYRVEHTVFSTSGKTECARSFYLFLFCFLTSLSSGKRAGLVPPDAIRYTAHLLDYLFKLHIFFILYTVNFCMHFSCYCLAHEHL